MAYINGRFAIITLCGGTFEQMQELASALTRRGNIVLVPTPYYHSQQKIISLENLQMLKELQKQRIDMSDILYVIGELFDDEIQAQINYAQHKGVEILYDSDFEYEEE